MLDDLEMIIRVLRSKMLRQNKTFAPSKYNGELDGVFVPCTGPDAGALRLGITPPLITRRVP